MNKEDHFEKNWEEFVKWKLTERPPERVDKYNLARMFYEFGFAKGRMEDSLE